MFDARPAILALDARLAAGCTCVDPAYAGADILWSLEDPSGQRTSRVQTGLRLRSTCGTCGTQNKSATPPLTAAVHGGGAEVARCEHEIAAIILVLMRIVRVSLEQIQDSTQSLLRSG